MGPRRGSAPLQGESGTRTFALQCGDPAAQEGTCPAILAATLHGVTGMSDSPAVSSAPESNCVVTRARVNAKELLSCLKRKLEQATSVYAQLSSAGRVMGDENSA